MKREIWNLWLPDGRSLTIVPYIHHPYQGPFYCAVAGDRKEGSPAVLVHGAGGSHLDWPSDLRRLPDRLVFAVDLPGHGRTAGPGRSSIEEYACWLGEALSLIHQGPWFVVGHSMGAAIALFLARERARILAGLVLIGVGQRLPVNPQIIKGLESDRISTLERIVRWAYSSELSDDGLARAGLDRLSRVDSDVLRGDFLACSAFDARPWLDAIEIPALVVAGSRDLMVPAAESALLAESLPCARWVLLEGAGHMVIFERSEEVRHELMRFFEDVEAGGICSDQ